MKYGVTGWKNPGKSHVSQNQLEEIFHPPTVRCQTTQIAPDETAGKRYPGLSAANLSEDFWRNPVDVDAQTAYQRGGLPMEDQQRRLSIKLRGREPTAQIGEDDQPVPASILGSSRRASRSRFPISDRRMLEMIQIQCKRNVQTHSQSESERSRTRAM